METANIMPKVLLVELDFLQKNNLKLFNAVTEKVAELTEWKRDLTMQECQNVLDFINNEKSYMELDAHFSNVRKAMVQAHPKWYW